MNNNHPRVNKDPNQAVVLTLRKRYSLAVRRSARQSATDRDLGLPSSSPVDPVSVTNPWTDATPRRPSGPLSHRLSYDHASGVIMLPDDGDWLEEDMDSDEEDYGTETAGGHGGLERSLTDTINSDDSTPVGASPTRARYATYFHHPERRRTVPGAFPAR